MTPPSPTQRRGGALSHTMGVQLLQAARARNHSWAEAMAFATWRAEEIRSAHRPFDFSAASAAYEANPFHWKVEQGGRLSHAEAAFAWTWWEDGFWRRELVTESALRNVTAHDRGVILPNALRNRDQL